jgi:hypothetical protein
MQIVDSGEAGCGLELAQDSVRVALNLVLPERVGLGIVMAFLERPCFFTFWYLQVTFGCHCGGLS